MSVRCWVEGESAVRAGKCCHALHVCAWCTRYPPVLACFSGEPSIGYVSCNSQGQHHRPPMAAVPRSCMLHGTAGSSQAQNSYTVLQHRGRSVQHQQAGESAFVLSIYVCATHQEVRRNRQHTMLRRAGQSRRPATDTSHVHVLDAIRRHARLRLLVRSKVAPKHLRHLELRPGRMRLPPPRVLRLPSEAAGRRFVVAPHRLARMLAAQVGFAPAERQRRLLRAASLSAGAHQCSGANGKEHNEKPGSESEHTYKVADNTTGDATWTQCAALRARDMQQPAPVGFCVQSSEQHGCLQRMSNEGWCSLPEEASRGWAAGSICPGRQRVPGTLARRRLPTPGCCLQCILPRPRLPRSQ